ncbi:hypothetical protein J437_LFUL015108 [Ladona fulva]|uniref:Peptidase S1 domain-containing protein n=1 Tax=Ladona fulva TaxID=123851 RepID=A0A8K0K345_LADFU|nr:hypothetical protein J437_LFUL015108 [Ladona fulva]
MRRCSNLHLEMGVQKVFIVAGILLLVSEFGCTSEDEQLQKSHDCECTPKDLCRSADVSTGANNCNQTSEVCCKKIPSIIPINKTISEDKLKKCQHHLSSSQIKDKQEANHADFPWMVRISEQTDGSNSELSYKCGGSLIHPTVVLTGAHCVFGKEPSQLRVVADELSSPTAKELSKLSKQVTTIEVHEDYDNQTLENDVALVFLQNITQNNIIGFTCIPLKGILPDPGTKCFVTVWRDDSAGNTLKKLDLTIIDDETCQSSLRKTKLGHRFILHNSFICGDSMDDTDITKEDGGSPLICPLPENPQIFIQSGLVARLVESKEYNPPGVFVNTANFREWIDSKMKENNVDTSYYSYS